MRFFMKKRVDIETRGGKIWYWYHFQYMTIAKNKIKNKSNLKSQEPLFEPLNVFNGEMETNPPTTLTMKLLLKKKKKPLKTACKLKRAITSITI